MKIKLTSVMVDDPARYKDVKTGRQGFEPR